MADTTPSRFLGWRMAALGFLAYNLGLYLSGGSYGPIVHDLQQRFELSRGMVSLGMSVQLLALSLSSPFVGSLPARVSVRKMMIAGAAMEGVAYFAMAAATNYTEILICYACVGVGSGLVGIISPTTLVSRWFEADRARALSIVNIPLFIMITPPVAGAIAVSYGSTGVFLAVGAVFTLLLPLLFFVVDRPEDVGQTPRRAESSVPLAPTVAAFTDGAQVTNRELLGSWQFWLLTLGLGFLIGPGVVFMVHSVPYAMQRGGVSVETASMVVSAFGGAGLIGTVLCGWLADKIGALRALSLTGIALGLGWGAFLLTDTIVPMIIVAGYIGILTTAVAAIHASAVNEIFGKESVPKVIGLTYFFKLPFLFGFPWLAGHLFDIAGGYQLPFILQIVGYMVAAAGFAVIAKFNTRAACVGSPLTA